ncbi:MAG: hypothetical protein ACRDYF_06560 [Acidimicrobiia bacterium]
MESIVRVRPGRLAPVALAILALAALAFPQLLGGRARAAAPVGKGLTEILLKFRVTGTFDSFDPVTNVLTFNFSGPFFATTGSGGFISDDPGKKLGDVVNARVQFTVGPTSDSFRFTCDQCEFRFLDGSVVRPLLDDPATPLHETDIPMEGRMLVELGPVPGPSPSVLNLRGAGCGGTRETAGKGKLANMEGALCVNGAFGFPVPLSTLLADPGRLVGLTGSGESNCTLVMHKPVLPA